MHHRIYYPAPEKNNHKNKHFCATVPSRDKAKDGEAGEATMRSVG